MYQLLQPKVMHTLILNYVLLFHVPDSEQGMSARVCCGINLLKAANHSSDFIHANICHKCWEQLLLDNNTFAAMLTFLSAFRSPEVSI